MPGVARFAAGEVEGDRMSVEIGFQVDLAGESAAGPAEGLTMLPPFAPAADTCARAIVESKSWTRCALSLVAARWSNMASNTPALLRREKRFHTVFQGPNSLGSARQEMLCTVK